MLLYNLFIIYKRFNFIFIFTYFIIGLYLHNILIFCFYWFLSHSQNFYTAFILILITLMNSSLIFYKNF